MTTGGYDAFIDPYCCRGAFVLKNEAGIRSEAEPQAFELEMTALRSRLRLPFGNCDPAHYRAVHHHLFQDVHTWAERCRTVRVVLTSKNGNGRAQLSFLNLFAGRAGHALDFDRLDPSTFMRAMIASFHGDAAPLSAEIATLGR